MFNKRYFEVEEIGTCSKLGPVILVKGRGKSRFGREKELVRNIFPLVGDYLLEIDSITTEGKVVGESEFVRNVCDLSGIGIEEMGITAFYGSNKGLMSKLRGSRKKPLRDYHTTSDLIFSDQSSIRGALPHDSIMHVLAGIGLGHGGIIHCDEDLYHYSETVYNGLLRDKDIKFKRIEDIEISDKKPEVHVDEKDYEKLNFDRVLFTESLSPRMTRKVYYTMIFTNGSRKVGFSFPWTYKTTFERVMQEPNVRRAMRKRGYFKAVVNTPNNPDWLADSITIIDKVIRRANINVGSIYIDASNIRKLRDGILIYNPRSAKTILSKDGGKMITPVPGRYVVPLSYLYGKDVWLRDIPKTYLA